MIGGVPKALSNFSVYHVMILGTYGAIMLNVNPAAKPGPFVPSERKPPGHTTTQKTVGHTTVVAVPDHVLRQQVPIEKAPVPSLWPPDDAVVLKTCRGGSKATVEICESPSLGVKYARKYVAADIRKNPEEWRLEQGRLENDLKTYQDLEHMALKDRFGGLYHHSRSPEEGLVLYLEYAGSTVLANHAMSDSETALVATQDFFTGLTADIVDICAHGSEGPESQVLRKHLFLDRIVNRLNPKDKDVEGMSNAEGFVREVQDLRGRWETCYTQLEALLLAGPVVALPTDTTFLNMMRNPETGEVKCIDPGKIDTTAAAYPLSKMLVFGPYYRFVNDKEFEMTASGFVPTDPVSVVRSADVLGCGQAILETLDPMMATQTIVAGWIQFGGDLGYRYNAEDMASGKTFADLSLFSRSLTYLEGCIAGVLQDMGLPPTKVLSEAECGEFAEKFVVQRGRYLLAEVAMLLGKEG